MSVTYALQFSVAGFTSSSGTVNTSGSQTFGGNTLIVADIVNNNNPFTGAPAAAPTMGGSAGLTWTQVWSRTQGGGSPTIRLSRFVAFPTTTVVGTVTATFSVSQLSSMSLSWVGGLDASSSGANSVNGVAFTNDSAGANVTAATVFSVSITGLTNPNDGLHAAFACVNGSAITHVAPYTELVDSSNPSGGRIETQFLNGLSAAAGASNPFANTPFVGGVMQCKASPSPAPIISTASVFDGTATASGYDYTFFATRGRYYLFLSGAAAQNMPTPTSVSPPTGTGWDPTLLDSWQPAAGPTQQAMSITGLLASDDAFVRLHFSTLGGAQSVMCIEVECDSTTYPNGWRQTKELHETSAGAPYAAGRSWTFDSALNDENSSVLILSNGLGGGPAATNAGWRLDRSSTATYSTCISRHNSSQPGFTGGVSAFGALALEFVGPPPYVEPGVAPDVEVYSPADLPAVSTDTPLVVDVTDADGDLDTVVITALMPDSEDVYTGGAFQTGYTDSSAVSTITDGLRFSIVRDDGWPASPTIHVEATDDAARETVAEFTWPLSRPPIVTIISPLPVGSTIASTTPIVFELTDPDDDIRRAVPLVLYPDGTDALIHDGDTFRPLFSGSSREAITGGWRYTVLPAAGRWPMAPTILPFLYDLAGLEAE